MFQLGKTIVSEDILQNDFACNLSACKGECCVSGEAGAPLEKKEISILKEIYPEVKPFLQKEGIFIICTPFLVSLLETLLDYSFTEPRISLLITHPS